MIVLRRRFVTESAAVVLAAACITSGCPLLAGDEFQIGSPSADSGAGGAPQAGAETGDAGTLSLGGNLNTGAAGHPPPSVEGGAAGAASTSAEGGGAAVAGNTNGGGSLAGSQGTCDDDRRSPGESDRDCGGVCEPCEDGSSCSVATDCESGRCTASGICRSCGLRLTSTDAACPATCTRCLGGTCYIDCDNAGVCRDVSLMCPPGLACRIECSAENGCSNLRVQ